LPVQSGSGAHEVTAADKTDERRRRDIVLVIAGGEGYVDFRRGISTPLSNNFGAFSALTLLVGRQEEYLACKN